VSFCYAAPYTATLIVKTKHGSIANKNLKMATQISFMTKCRFIVPLPAETGFNGIYLNTGTTLG
jgi:hypothetical protein